LAILDLPVYRMLRFIAYRKYHILNVSDMRCLDSLVCWAPLILKRVTGPLKSLTPERFVTLRYAAAFQGSARGQRCLNRRSTGCRKFRKGQLPMVSEGLRNTLSSVYWSVGIYEPLVLNGSTEPIRSAANIGGWRFDRRLKPSLKFGFNRWIDQDGSESRTLVSYYESMRSRHRVKGGVNSTP